MPDIARRDEAAILESVVIQGDLARLTAAERTVYYHKVCESLGLNPLTRPFEYIMLNGKLTLYARKDATDQLRMKKSVSLKVTRREKVDDIYLVEVEASAPDLDPMSPNTKDRVDFATGAVSVKNLTGEAYCNAIMKAETKAKRRATLSICGLGFTDETELETIPGVVVPTPEIQRPAAIASPDKEPPVDAYENELVEPTEPDPDEVPFHNDAEVAATLGPKEDDPFREVCKKEWIRVGDFKFKKVLKTFKVENAKDITDEGMRARFLKYLAKVQS